MSQSNIVVIGMKACGKTTYGKKLAQQLNKIFVDVDHEIENLYQQQSNEKLAYPDIHRKVGDKKFREFEQQVIATIAKNTNQVIATGGSSLLNKNNQQALQTAKIIYLSVKPEILLSRWQQKLPSFINPDNLEQEFENYFQQRDVLYQTLANKVIEVD